jgi:hypothetical protein
MKEKSRSHICQMKNVNGNILDKAICEEIKKLGEDNSEFILQLKAMKKHLEGNNEEYSESLERLRIALTENDKEISALVASLTKASATPAEDYILKQIDDIHHKGEIIKRRISELENITTGHELSSIEFDVIRQMLASFRDTLEDMNVEQKRAALRTFIKKVVWDGENVHLYLFGSDEGAGIDLPSDGLLLNIDNPEPQGEDSK